MKKSSWKHEDKQGKMDLKTLRKRRKKVYGNTKTNKEKEKSNTEKKKEKVHRNTKTSKEK